MIQLDYGLFKEALSTLLTSWGSDTPPEAVWAANEFLRAYYTAMHTPIALQKFFVEDDMEKNEEVLSHV